MIREHLQPSEKYLNFSKVPDNHKEISWELPMSFDAPYQFLKRVGNTFDTFQRICRMANAPPLV
jgi:hypothetical protein